jgi:hypothetical protein
MKTINIGITALVLALAPSMHAEVDAAQKFHITATDDSGRPMANLLCKVGLNPAGFQLGLAVNQAVGKTDASGIVEIAGRTIQYQTSVYAELPGYYPCLVSDFWTLKRNGDHWEPWPVEVKLVMKKIINPHPMYAAEHDAVFPDVNKPGPLGFDLLEMDWVAPVGKGKTADFVLEGIRQNPADRSESPKGWIRLSFPHPGDGIQRMESSEAGWSDLVGPHEAPETGYVPKWEFQTWENEEDAQAGYVKPQQVYVFRVRTVLDKDGKVLSTRYGKIPERIHASLFHMRPGMILKYYLNGKDNDRSLEWDRKNLFKDLDKTLWLQRP